MGELYAIPANILRNPKCDKDTMYYVGALSAVCVDIETLPLNSDYVRQHEAAQDLLDTPLAVGPSGNYPDVALRTPKLGS